MRFKTLHLENFQAHKNTTISFSSGLNIIIGESDVGKSSILRALRKLIRDVPAGKDFVNKDASGMKLSLTVIDEDEQEYIIVRQITASKNLYYLDDQEFGGFGREIPEEIQKVLEMFLIELENSEKIDLHFSGQHDTPFMISKGSAGVRSKLLGRVAGLHTLDKGIVWVNKDIRAGNSMLKTRSMDRDNLHEKIDTLPDIDHEYTVYNSCKKDLQSLETELITLSKLYELKKSLDDIVKRGKQLKEHFNELPDVKTDFQVIRTTLQMLSRLQELHVKLNAVEKQTTLLESKKFDAVIQVDFQAMHITLQTLGRLQELHSKLSNIETQTTLLESKKFDDDIQKAQQEWTTVLKELKICPVCKQSTLKVK